MNRTKVFISYSHKDEAWLERLQVHLKPLEREGRIDRWDATLIKPGKKWREEIEKALSSAKVAVLLVSADFLASDFIVDNELPPLLAAAEADGAVIIPVILSPSLFEQTGLAQFQAVNPANQPVIDMGQGAREQVFVKAAEAIQIAIEKTARTGARPRHVPQKKQIFLHWDVGNRTRVFSGIVGTAVLMALISYLLSQGPEPSGEDLNVNIFLKEYANYELCGKNGSVPYAIGRCSRVKKVEVIEGSSVRLSYDWRTSCNDYPRKSGQIDAKLSGTILHGKWIEVEPVIIEGELYLEFQSDFSEAKGWWKVNKNKKENELYLRRIAYSGYPNDRLDDCQ